MYFIEIEKSSLYDLYFRIGMKGRMFVAVFQGGGVISGWDFQHNALFLENLLWK